MLDFTQRIAASQTILLDGATGTELQRRGMETRLPLWSAAAIWECPVLLEQIHRDYVVAGADVLTANTFRTHARSLAAASLGDGASLDDRASELTRAAVEIARKASGGRALVAGSQAPLEDCYEPGRAPPVSEMEREHAWMARNLADARVDLILVETHNTIREAVVATRAAAQTGLPVVASLVCGEDGRLLSGESVSDAARALLPFKPQALLLNCCPAPAVERPLRQLCRVASAIPCGAYANIGRSDPSLGWVNTDAQDPTTYARYAATWLELGAAVIGGCCGTTPEHIRRLRTLLDSAK